MSMWTCAACGGDNPEGTRFCGHCGTPAGPAPPSTVPATPTPVAVPGPPPPIEPAPAPDVTEALKSFLSKQVADRVFEEGGQVTEERRLVTALFADLSGFTPLADRLDPEELLEVIDPIIRELTNVVGRYEGYVDKFAGDALLAFFGAPVAHDDDADRALMVAAEMHRQLARLRAELPPAAGELTLHVGVNSGHVVARVIGSEVRLDYSVLGDAVILAQRLESATPPGETYVGETTVELTRRRFEFEPIGELALKGKARPVRAWRLIGRRAADRDARAGGPDTVAFVGRGAELALVHGILEGARGGRGGVAAIAGEPGVGKSRLLQELRATEPSVRWLDARCLSFGAGLAYWPYGELLRAWAGIAPDDDHEHAAARLRGSLARIGPADAEQFFARLLGLPVPAGTSADRLEPEAFRRGLHSAFASWLRALAAIEPFVIVLEDVHWMDAASRALTADVARTVPDVAAALVLTTRRADDAVVDEVMAAAPVDRTRTVALEPLDASGIRHLVETMLGGAVPERLLEVVHDRAGGNPFFVEEIVRSLRDDGSLVPDGGAWNLAEGWRETLLPATVEEVLSARIDLLPRSAANVLQTAAVIGRRVRPLLLLAVLTSSAAAGASADLARLVGAGLLDPGPSPDEFSFHHALVQDVAYSRLIRRRRRELHLRVAEAAEQLYGAGDDAIELLARHLYLGGAGPKAVDALVRAGERARRLFANDEAIGHLEHAVEVAGQHEETRERLDEIELSLADVLELVGRYEDARRLYSEVRDRARDVRAWRGIASTLRRQGRYAEALSATDEALATSELSGADVRTLWLERGWCLAMSGQFQSSLDAFRTGLGTDRERGDTVDGQLLIEMARIETDMGHLDDALAHGTAAYETFDRQATQGDLAKAMRVVGWTLHDLGRLDESVAMLRRGLDVAQRLGSVEEIGACLINLGLAEMERGNLDEAIACDVRAIAEFERVGHGSGRVTGYANLAEALFHAGRYDEALEYCARTLDLARSIDHRWAIPDVMRTMALIDLERGDLERAATRAEEAAELNIEMGAVRFAGDALRLAAKAWHKAGNEARAEELSARASSLVESS
jgi:adenylate cyclase